MDEIHSLVIQARAFDADLKQRHRAFGALVARFQDMACGFAYSVMGDFHLAQDAAQEAFLTAYRELGKLRTPEAFPGWFRKIVLTQCSRMTRGERLRVERCSGGAPQPDAPAAPADCGSGGDFATGSGQLRVDGSGQNRSCAAGAD